MTDLPKRLAKSAPRRTALTLLTTLAAIGGSALAVSAAATKPDFSVSGSPGNQHVFPGDPASYTVSVRRSGGFAGSVAMSVSGLPGGSTATFTPASVPPGGSASTLEVQTSGATPRGSYTLRISGAGSPGTRTDTVSLTVTEPGFTISGSLAAPLSLGGSGQPLNLVISNPFNKALTVSGIQVAVLSTSRSGCPTSQFTVVQMPGSYSVTVPKNATESLSQLGSRYMPRVIWQDLPYPQNGCLGAHLTFSYTAAGQR
jgi:hypothetical protein